MIEAIPLHGIRNLTTPRVDQDTMRALFQLWDSDGDGHLTLSELEVGLHKYGLTSEATRQMFFPEEEDDTSDEQLYVNEVTFGLYADRIDDVARRVVIITMEENPGESHSGMTFQLGFLGEDDADSSRWRSEAEGGEAQLQEFVEKLQAAVQVAKHRNAMHTARKRFQARLSHVYHRNEFQWTIALLIVLNFVLSAAQVRTCAAKRGCKTASPVRARYSARSHWARPWRFRIQGLACKLHRRWGYPCSIDAQTHRGRSIKAATYNPFLLAQLQVHPPVGSSMHRMFEDGDLAFTIIFTLEVMLNMAAHWFEAFWRDGWSCSPPSFIITMSCPFIPLSLSIPYACMPASSGPPIRPPLLHACLLRSDPGSRVSLPRSLAICHVLRARVCVGTASCLPLHLSTCLTSCLPVCPSVCLRNIFDFTVVVVCLVTIRSDGAGMYR